MAEYTEEELEANGFRLGEAADGRFGLIYYPELDECLPNPRAWLTNGFGINSLKDMRKVRRYLAQKGQ